MTQPPDELLVIDKAYGLVLWSWRHIANFPRSHRFTLGEGMERRLYDLLDLPLSNVGRKPGGAFRQTIQSLSLPDGDVHQAVASPIGWIHADPYPTMKGRVRPCDDLRDVPALHRVVVGAIHVARVIRIVPNGMFPKAPLPDPSLASGRVWRNAPPGLPAYVESQRCTGE